MGTYQVSQWTRTRFHNGHVPGLTGRVSIGELALASSVMCSAGRNMLYSLIKDSLVQCI